MPQATYFIRDVSVAETTDTQLVEPFNRDRYVHLISVGSGMYFSFVAPSTITDEAALPPVDFVLPASESLWCRGNASTVRLIVTAVT